MGTARQKSEKNRKASKNTAPKSEKKSEKKTDAPQPSGAAKTRPQTPPQTARPQTTTPKTAPPTNERPTDAHSSDARPTDERTHNGRPFKFGEPTVKREFRLPETMDEKLIALARSRGNDISDVLRAALTKELASDQPNQQTNSTNEPTNLTNEQTKSALKAALLELIPGLQTGAQLQVETAAARDTATQKAVPLHAARQINAGVAWAEGEAARLQSGVSLLRPQISDARVTTVPLLGKTPCGPWQESLNRAEAFVMSAELATFVGYEAGDFFAIADGASMQASGIPDGALILMRPLEQAGVQLAPQNGEIALIEITTSDGDCFSTVKHFYQTPNGAPDLRDGAGRPFYPPSDARSVKVVAVKRGLLSRG